MRKIFGLAFMLVALAMVVGTIAPAEINLYNRSASALVVDDKHGLIMLNGIGPYGQIVALDGAGRMKIDFNNLPHCAFAPFATGPNADGTFKLQDVIQLHNAGPETYDITIASDNPRVKFWTRSGMWWPALGPTQTLTVDNLPSGWNLDIGVYLDTTGLGAGASISAVITITADNP